MATEVFINVREGSEVPPEYADIAARLAEAAVSAHAGDGDFEVCISIVDDEEIRRLNKEYRHVDRATDVLSFAMRESAGPAAFLPADIPEPLGDIVISIETAAKQALDYGHPLLRELAFLTVHGLLHLLGFDHPEGGEDEGMRAEEERILGALGLAR